MSQMKLMSSGRFLPLFITQFFGALNDNVFKNALIILLAFNASLLPSGMSEGLAVNISAGLFILPYFLFSSLAGQLADYNEKANLIKKLKLIELGLIALCCLSLIFKNVYLMWLSLFLMGVQSTFFGPLKYAILPQHLKNHELVGGNSLIEMGTFISILIGTIAGGVLVSMENGVTYICVLLFLSSLVGVYSSSKIPKAKPSTEGKVSFNIFKQTVEIIKISKEVRSVFLSILGISWFWFLGATFLAQFPLLVKNVLVSHENTVTVLLIVFSIGIAAGSLICEKLSRGRVEPGIVPFGAIGMTLFGGLLYVALNKYQLNNTPNEVLSIIKFLNIKESWLILTSLFLMAVFGGFFTVPLYAMIQSRSKPENRSRTIASNNIINSLFMITSAIYAIVCFQFDISVNNLLLGVVVFNALISIYIFTIIPEFMMRFFVWLIVNVFYRVKVQGEDNIPEEGAGVVVANHISFLDALVVFGSIRRPVKFVMYYKIFNIPIANALFRSVGAIPIAGKTENEEVFNSAFHKMKEYLEQGELVMIFPEGKIAQEEIVGKINEFKGGVSKLVEQVPVPIYPSALSGLYGSMFSRAPSKFRYFPKSFFSRKIKYKIGQPVSPSVTLKELENKIISLRDK